jgi:2-desacetyl-2-hydroxyethyl bacteriochlorophyllide A dehydrogenase
MRAAFLHGRLDVRVEPTPAPTIQDPHEVLLAIDYAGICGSELHTIDLTLGALPTPPDGAPLRLPLGHEYAGRVVAVGDAVRTVTVGQRATVAPRGPCFACDLCRNGASAICRKMTQRGGAWADAIVAPDTLVYALPDGLPTVVGALTEPLSCAVRILDRAGLRPGLTVCVIGAGPIGLMTAALARHSGAGLVIVSEPRPRRRQVAARLGLEQVVDPTATDLQQVVLERTGGRGVDISIEAVGLEPALTEATRLVAPGGTVLWGGLAPAGLRVSLAPQDMFMREYTLRTAWGGVLEFERTLRLEQAIDWSSLVEEVFPLDRVMEAVTFARTEAAGKVLLSMGIV